MQTTPPDSTDTTLTHGPKAIARQPILDVHRVIFGYELFDRSRKDLTHTAASDAELLFNVLSQADNTVLVERKLMFVNCTHDSLAGGHLDLILPDQVVLELPPPDSATPQDVEMGRQRLLEITKRGFRIAFDQFVLAENFSSWLALASFVKVDLTRLTPAEVAPTLRQALKHSHIKVIAEKVETAEQFEQCRDLGVSLFQGYWFAKPELFTGHSIRPSQATIVQLINLVRNQASTADIEELLKRDAVLSFTLLRFINSAGFGLTKEVTSFRHAVMILGLKKLFRWAALLLTTSKSSDLAPAVGHTAIVRGRLMELLAAETLPPEESENAFLVGIFSMLDILLGVPLDKALAAIALPTEVTDALLQNCGPLAPFLQLTLACEEADDAVFAQAATTLQLSNHQVNWAHLQALAWAESLLD
ncbi:MAG: hypothetical protein RLZZ591_806 [Pseudomonadota bacterium]|jgi:EAL and modified HD-GYP domain-containing signal transduction protein